MRGTDRASAGRRADVASFANPLNSPARARPRPEGARRGHDDAGDVFPSQELPVVRTGQRMRDGEGGKDVLVLQYFSRRGRDGANPGAGARPRLHLPDLRHWPGGTTMSHRMKKITLIAGALAVI